MLQDVSSVTSSPGSGRRRWGGRPGPGHYRVLMLFMVVERFRGGQARPVYERAREQGRLLPEGLRYVESWVAAGFARWSDLVDFEIVPVAPSAQASPLMS